MRSGAPPQTNHLLHDKTGRTLQGIREFPTAEQLADDQATNFGENIAFVRALLPQARRITFVTKPNSVLRVALTVPVQWPQVTAFVDSPALSFPNEVSQIIGVLGVIHEMVGDIERILRYPARGFQVPHELPPLILNAYEALVAEDFGLHSLR